VTGKRWIESCQFFLQPHPELHPAGEKVYVPKDKLTIRLWFEGGLQVAGDTSNLELNFNSDEYLVLAVRTDSRSRIFRVPWERLVSLELELDAGDNPNGYRSFFFNGRA
jgi:hypothetical protein